MPETSPIVQTSVQQVDLDIDSWLATPGADSVVLPSPNSTAPNAAPKASIFSSPATDLSFIDKEDEDSEEGTNKGTDNGSTEASVSRETQTGNVFDDIVDAEIQDESEESAEHTPKKGGRPRTEKSGLVEFLKKRIESKEMFAFDDYDETKQTLDDYLSSLGEKDIDELWQANIDNLKQEVAAQTPKEFFESLPEELQYAAKYVMDGGQDLRGLFQALSQVEQVRELDPSQEGDQEYIIRNYLQATGFGSQEEIEEELTTWKDLGVLEKKAKQFKPKLDLMQEQMVQAQLEEQELRKQQQEQAAQAFMQNVFEALRPGELGGVKLDKKTQAKLYTGLTQPQYRSVITGQPTNLFGHLLEKYQYTEPNYPLIAEALWLLENPEEYKQNLIRQGKNQAVEQTVRQLKTEQSQKRGASAYEEPEEKPRRLTRPQNIFKR